MENEFIVIGLWGCAAIHICFFFIEGDEARHASIRTPEIRSACVIF